MNHLQAFWISRPCTAAELRGMRLDMSVKQKDLAQLLRIAPETLSRMERGHMQISFPVEVLVRYMRIQEGGGGHRIKLIQLCDRLASRRQPVTEGASQ